jgi:hypothetical protein
MGMIPDSLSDTALSQYSQIASMPQPNSLERALLHEWISSPAMGGGCGFLGRDLGGHEQPSVYDAVHQMDLAILSDAHGEDDLFTKFLTGPLLTLYHSILRHRRVSCRALFGGIHIAKKLSHI